MRLLPFPERSDPADDAMRVRSRVEGMHRAGWIPRVPRAAGPATDAQPADPPGPEPGFDEGESGARRRRHSATGSAVADRLPVALRSALASLPLSARSGWFGLDRRAAMVVVLVVIAGVAIAVGWLVVSHPQVERVQTRPSAALVEEEPAGRRPATATPSPAVLVVHVAGKVHRPGVVRLPPGSRVVDAVSAAGGLQPDVEPRLNLARPLTDGEQVLVGEEPPRVSSTPAREPADVAGGRVNLNTASTEQLETLPGIGPALAKRIAAWRDDNGSFTAIDELLEVSGIGPARLDALLDLVIV